MCVMRSLVIELVLKMEFMNLYMIYSLIVIKRLKPKVH